jgi:hypothetical protein
VELAIYPWNLHVAPGAPYTVAVWPGIEAPSGVLFVGLAFTCD